MIQVKTFVFAPFKLVPHRIYHLRKEAIYLSATGYIQVHAYASNAQIPQKDTTVAVTDLNGSVIAMRLTNSSGQLDQPIPISVPDRSESLTPNPNVVPFTTVNLYAKKENFEEIYIEALQVFADIITLQPLQLIPNAELPAKWNKTETFITSAQNL